MVTFYSELVRFILTSPISTLFGFLATSLELNDDNSIYSFLDDFLQRGKYQS